MREPSATAASSDQLSATRWRKYGKDRLYVNDGAGRRVGWVDLVTGSVTVERQDLRAALDAAVEAWRVESGEDTPPRGSGGGEQVMTSDAPRNAAGPTDATSVVAPAQFPTASGGSVMTAPRSPSLAEAYTRPTEAIATGQPLVAKSKRAAADHSEAADPPWVDLALNVPGQAAREQAELELATQKARSRVGSFIARTFDVKTDERAWRVGAGGEETVGAKLEKLVKHGWHVLHAVPVGERGSDIDHVVIGHGGVYTLNTKTHPGGKVWVGKHQVRVNGHATNYLRNSRFEAQRAEQMLTAAVGFPVMVRPTLVFLTGTLIPDVTIKQSPEDVLILDRTDIPGAFKRAPHRLTADQVEAVFEQARRSTTWHRSKSGSR